jgi:hypothetical protein
MHLGLLLDAELASLNRKKDIANTLYEETIATAARGGFVQDAALANECFAEFFFRDTKDGIEAKYRFEEAIKFYIECGAQAKAHLLRQKCTALFPEK